MSEAERLAELDAISSELLSLNLRDHMGLAIWLVNNRATLVFHFKEAAQALCQLAAAEEECVIEFNAARAGDLSETMWVQTGGKTFALAEANQWIKDYALPQFAYRVIKVVAARAACNTRKEGR